MTPTITESNQAAASIEKTTLSFTRCPSVPTASALAWQLGLIQEEFASEPDFEVIFKSIGFTGKLEYAHHERFWLRNAGHAPAVWARSHGVASAVVALAWLEGSYPVLARRPEIQSLKDLRGKRLALVKRANASFDLMIAQQLKIYTTALATVGLTLDDIELVDLILPEASAKTQTASVLAPSPVAKDPFAAHARVQVTALLQDQVDVIVGRLPDDVRAFHDLRTLYDTRDHPVASARVHPSVLRGVVVSAALLKERRDVVVRYLARLLQAADGARAHPRQAIEKVAQDLKTTPEVLINSYDSVADGLQLTLDDDKVLALEAQKNFLLKHGFIPRDFDVAPWVDRGPLAEAQRLYAQWQRTGYCASARAIELSIASSTDDDLLTVSG